MKSKNLPIIALIGRTNVGKSAIFNCLTEKKSALVSGISGTTRDSNIGEISWNNFNFEIIDTGGIMDVKAVDKKHEQVVNDIDHKVQLQTRLYLKKADVLLIVVDVRAGLLAEDRNIIKDVRKAKKKGAELILVVNKADSKELRRQANEFFHLGLGEPSVVSATTGSGTGDLLDRIVNILEPLEIAGTSTNSLRRAEEKKEEELEDELNEDDNDPLEEDREFEERHDANGIRIMEDDDRPINVCIIGKPNVGKSSMINAMLGENRVIVSPMPHTTREPQDIAIVYEGRKINFIDTAGITKRGQKQVKHTHVRESLDRLSIEKSLQALHKAHVALLVIDINEGLTVQEAKLADEIIKNRCSLIIVANKWDLVKEKDTELYNDAIHREMMFAQWAPIQYTSALTGSKLNKMLDLIIDVADKRKIRISDSRLEKFLKKIVKIRRPVKAGGERAPRIYSIRQIRSNPPQLEVRIGAVDTLNRTYMRFIENKLRSDFDITGTPVGIRLINNKKIHGMAQSATAPARKVNSATQGTAKKNRRKKPVGARSRTARK